MTALGMIAFAIGLPGMIGAKILITNYYSRKDTRYPVRAAVIAVIFNFFGIILRSFGHMLAVSIDDFTLIMHQKVTNVGIWYVQMH